MTDLLIAAPTTLLVAVAAFMYRRRFPFAHRAPVVLVLLSMSLHVVGEVITSLPLCVFAIRALFVSLGLIGLMFVIGPWIKRPAAATLIALLLTTTAHAQDNTPPAPEPPTAEQLEKCVHLVSIGASSTGNEYRIGWGIPQNGWRPVVRNRFAKTLHDHNLSRIQFHNPFGHWSGIRMQWTQRQRLQGYADRGDEQAARILAGFLPAMRSLLDGDFTFGRKINVIIYLGDAQTDEILAPLLAEGDLAGWVREWTYAVEPVLTLATEFPGQIGIGCDSAEELETTHPHYLMLRRLSSQGIQVFIEPRPRSDRPHLFDLGSMSVWRQDANRLPFDRTNSDQFPDAKAVGHSQETGKRIALLTNPNRVNARGVQRVLNSNTTPAFNVEFVLRRFPR